MTPLIRSVPTPEPPREPAAQPAAPSWDCFIALVEYVAKLQRDGDETVTMALAQDAETHGKLERYGAEVVDMALAQYDETRGKLHRAVQREAHHMDHRARNSGDEVRERLIGTRRG